MNWIQSLLHRLGLAARPNRKARRAIRTRLALTPLEDRVTPSVAIWDGGGGDSNWTTAANWVGDAAPVAGDDLVFAAGASRLTNTNDFAAGTSFASVTLGGAGYAVTGNSIVLTGDVSATYSSSSSAFALDTDLGGGNVVVATGGTLDLGGALSGSAGLTVAGGGTVQLTGGGSNSYTGGTTLVAGTLELNKSGATAVTAGTFTIGDGSGTDLVRLTASNQIDDSASVVLVTSGTLDLNNFDDAIGALDLTGATVATGSGTLTLGGDVTSNSAGTTAVISGNLDLGGATRTFTVADNAALDPDLSVTANISGTGAGLVKAGADGQLLLSGTNTYDGGTSADGGVLEIGNSDALGTGTASINSGASLALYGGITVANTLAISGLPVTNLSKIMSVSGDNTIQGAVGITGGNNVAFDVAGGTTLTVSGAISGSLDFDKNNAGTLVLSGTNTHTGNVNVGNGRLVVNGSLATSNSVFVDGTLGGSGALPAVTISSIGTLAPGTSPGLLSTGDLAFSDSGSTYAVELNGATAGTQYDQTDVTGTVLLAGATLSLSLGYGPAIGTTYTIINNDGTDAVGGTFNGLAEGATLTLGATTLTISYAGGSNSNDVVLTVTDVTYTWDGGGGDDNWTTAANWVGDVAPTAGSNLVFAGGAARMTNLNDFAANTSFYSITIAAGGYLVSGNAITLTNGISFTAASGASEFQLNVALTATETVDVADGGDFIVSGAISGAGFGITKTGGGTLEYTGFNANTYTGATTVNAGTLILNRASGLNAIAGNLVIGDGSGSDLVQVGSSNQIADSSAISIASSGTLDLGGTSDTIGALAFTGGAVTTGAGTLTLASGGSVTTLASSQTATFSGNLAFGGPNNFFTVAQGTTSSGVDLDVSAVVSSFANIIKAGAGTLALSGANTYSGGTNINSGVLAISHDTGAGTGVVNILGTGTLDVSGSISVSNTLNVSSSGTAIRSSAGANTLGGGINLGANTTIDVGTSSIVHVAGTVDDSANSYVLTKTGLGTMQLSGTNTYGGGTNVSAGSLQVFSTQATGTAGTVVLAAGTTLFDSAAVYTLPSGGLQLGSGSTFSAPLSGAQALNGAVDLAGDATFDLAAGAVLTATGPFVGAAGFTTTGAGELILSNSANSFGGNVNVLGGTLSNGGNSVIPNSAVVTVNGAGAVYNLGDFDDIVSGLTLVSGSVTGTNLSVLFSLTAYDVRDGSISAVLQGVNGLTKTTAGTVTLSGANTYIGTTTVSAGTLLINGSVMSPTTVAAGATLGGSGTVSGIVTVQSGGTLAPGNSPGLLSTGALSFTSGATFSVELNGATVGTQYDQANVTGTVTLAGATLSAALGFAPADGAVFTVINNDGSDAVSGTFNGLAEGAIVTLSGIDFRLSYVGGDGNDVTLAELVAEPPAPAPVPLVAVGAGAGQLGVVSLYDPRTGALVGQLVPFAAFDPFGGVKVAVGDVNGDGYADLIATPADGFAGGLVFIYSGRDFSLMSAYYALPGGAGGANIASGDVNGDGLDDVIVGTATGADLVVVYSGAGSTPLSVVSAFGGYTTGVTVGAGDVDGDGRDDVITGTASGFAQVYVRDGVTGQLLAGFLPFGLFDVGGVNVAGGDLNGDGRSEVVMGFGTVPAVLTYDGATFGLSGAVATTPGVGERVSTADRDGDGRADIVTATTSVFSYVQYFSGLTFAPLDALFAGTPLAPTGVYVAGRASPAPPA